jgi:hypothetical protein
MHINEVPPQYIEVNGSTYMLDTVVESSYTMLTYEHLPKQEDSFLLGVIGDSEGEARIKMLGLLVKEGLIH